MGSRIKWRDYKHTKQNEYEGKPASILITAKYDGECFICRKKIKAGEKVNYYTAIKKVYHDGC